MVRYQGKVAVFRATVPLGAPVDRLPPARNFIDELVFKKLKEVGMPPSPVCDDATFLRRVTVDIAGRLPTPEEAKKFLADTIADKRDKLIDRAAGQHGLRRLLRQQVERAAPQQADAAGERPRHVRVPRLGPRQPADQQAVRPVRARDADRHRRGRAEPAGGVVPPGEGADDAGGRHGPAVPRACASQCAQCHHHPFEKWSQQDYYSFSAFFSRVGRKPAAVQSEEVDLPQARATASATNPQDQADGQARRARRAAGEPPARRRPARWRWPTG